MSKNVVVSFLLLLLLSLGGGCTGHNSMTEPVAQKAEKQNLQAIYLSREDGYFTAAEFELQQHAELTSDFSKFISLADQFPDAVLLIDHNAIQDVDIQQLKEIMGRNERLLLIGYQNPREKIGLEEYWNKPHEDSATPIPDRGFCHFILNDGKHADFTEEWRQKLPLLQRIDQYTFHKTLDELMTAAVKSKKHYEGGSGQTYNYNWESSVKNNL
ncbi:MAG: hypothetical protein GX938_08855 [Spirochaetales bacterium]|nr:hypothetical protein [Spirochaetales bacterium]